MTAAASDSLATRLRASAKLHLAQFALIMALLALASSDHSAFRKPFGLSPIPENADIFCGSVLSPSNDTGYISAGRTTSDVCAAWLHDRKIEALLFGLLAVAVMVAMAVDSWIERRRERQGGDGQLRAPPVRADRGFGAAAGR